MLIGGNFTLNNTHKSESNLLVEIINFRKNTKAKIPEKANKKNYSKSLYALFNDS